MWSKRERVERKERIGERKGKKNIIKEKEKKEKKREGEKLDK